MKASLKKHFERWRKNNSGETFFLWEQGTYTFEQIRRKENYDYLFFLGISPFTAHAWIISKTDALNVATKQHGEDTKWLQIDPNDNERWQGEFKNRVGILEICL